MRKLALIAVVLTFAAANPARAATETFYFGNLLSPSGPAYVDPDGGSTWAQLSVSTLANPSSYSFSLTLGNGTNGLASFASIFGSGAFVSESIFNLPADIDPLATTITNSTGVSNVLAEKNAPNVGGITFDFGDCFGTGTTCSHSNTTSGRLMAGETVSWVSTFSKPMGDPLAFADPAAALHVQSISTASGFDSAWYVPATPVPEPATSAMLLAGLSLMGFVAGRRRRGLRAAIG